MANLGVLTRGLSVSVPPPRTLAAPAEKLITEEAAITARPKDDFRVEALVEEGQLVAQGAPVPWSPLAPGYAKRAMMLARRSRCANPSRRIPKTRGHGLC